MGKDVHNMKARGGGGGFQKVQGCLGGGVQGDSGGPEFRGVFGGGPGGFRDVQGVRKNG